MTEHPILYTAEMVRAYLAGRKGQTRRVLYEMFSRGHLERVARGRYQRRLTGPG